MLVVNENVMFTVWTSCCLYNNFEHLYSTKSLTLFCIISACRLTRKLQKHWLILKNILTCLSTGKLHILLKLELRRKGIIYCSFPHASCYVLFANCQRPSQNINAFAYASPCFFQVSHLLLNLLFVFFLAWSMSSKRCVLIPICMVCWKETFTSTDKFTGKIWHQFGCFPYLCRGVYPPAADYGNYAGRPTTNLVEAFSNMRVDEEPLENGELDHEV